MMGPPSLPSAEQWKRVYLATYPRSGNHWVRYLIEEVTHIATSSVYCDADVGKSHMGAPFPWGGYCAKFGYEGRCRYPTPNEIVVVKTHFPAIPARRFDRMPFIKTIRIVRHPIDSLYSFYLFGLESKSYNSRMPKELLTKRIHTWKKFHQYWDRQDNVVTVRYEDLLLEPLLVLKCILEHIDYFASDESIKKAIEKYPPCGNLLKHINQYEGEDLDLITSELGELMKQFNYSIP